ncbi:DUF456 domain-containing protein [Cellvibrio sp. pealriver]|uniref:DUF456 domain-containing protein n=1 Tax=Cellvibrio sp. pealriver TaxID=1622269 RepID=UPI00066FE56E|nr:DUF456 domain-containing protein [Cellvibrio sp. pealriver]
MLLFLLIVFIFSSAVIWYFLNKKNYSVAFVLLAFLIGLCLVGVYLASSYVDPKKLGSAEQFGQFGDYIGGILNPIFGFVTIVLLINTFHNNNRQLEIVAESNLHEKIKKISMAISSTKEKIHQELNRKYGFMHEGDYKTESFMNYFFENGFPKKNLKQLLFSISEHTENLFIREWNTKSLQQGAHSEFKEHIMMTLRIRFYVEYIVNAHFRLIDSENSGILKYKASLDLAEFCEEMELLFLLTKNKSQEFKDAAVKMTKNVNPYSF